MFFCFKPAKIVNKSLESTTTTVNFWLIRIKIGILIEYIFFIYHFLSFLAPLLPTSATNAAAPCVRYRLNF